MRFVKSHGCGNDYVYVNCLEETVRNPGAVARYISDRHFGVGSDGLILIAPSRKADFRMEMYNADGSEGGMCGNGIRCLAKYVYDHGLTDRTRICVETKAGVRQLFLTVKDRKVTGVKVNMGAPILEADRIPVLSEHRTVIGEPVSVGGRDYRITCVSMGNPHAVTFVEDIAALNLEKTGPLFEHHRMFPQRVNTEFVQLTGGDEIFARVWERGAGETLACGTGACACAAACVLNGYTKERVTVHLPGGDLEIFYDRNHDTIWMDGPAVEVFDGKIDLSAVDV